MSEINWSKIDGFCETNKKPGFVNATMKEWNDSLTTIREHVAEMDFEDGDGWDTDKVWTMIWFAAVHFFRGRS